ncbi:hypothetical protein [Parvularcula maris]|uniref:Uncharacterized protein n=1 Tax=Parvularcula maris TaxID=2965077 RepID=A0A9X2RJF2_9PROT|nr:hypothetical protein [Parvularcula maris]MCQ8184638.1 hypothetical protein [Parvularcula maris]
MGIQSKTWDRMNWQMKFVIFFAGFGVGRMIYVILSYYGVVGS